MPNFATALKAEIIRLSRKEVRGEADAIKKVSAAHRRDIASLKRQMRQLSRQVALLEHAILRATTATQAAKTGKQTRFAAKGLRSQRERLGLSAMQFGRLAGVSSQSIYNWERGLSKPRAAQLDTLIGIRGIGKNQAHARLKQMNVKNGKSRRKPG